jgi:uncharacterized protein with ParB-like and HNH nuclease domain
MTSTDNVKDPLTLLPINKILDGQFFIPYYQRGFRWTKQQVEDLLNDIDSFIPVQIQGKPDEETFYCLQPIVLKKCNEQVKAENQLEGEWYEVIDGQQRLTTMYLIMHYANEMWTGRQKNKEITINYQTRKGSMDFLKDITVEEDDTVKISKKYIDYYYISSAYRTIHKWVSNYSDNKGKPFDENKFKSKFNSNAQIIWYEVAETENSTKLFERLNIGKIPLTNAELIKALFLSSSSFPDLSSNEQLIKRIEIARLWDDMEHKLNEPDAKFWSFITNKKRETFATKIELILDMIARKKDDERDPLATFIYFSKLQKEQGLEEIWKSIEHHYLTLNEWFKNKKMYHKIGYLITAKSKVSISDLVAKSIKSTKSDFNTYLNQKIAETVNFEITELRYERHPSQIQNVLLLFNVETIRLSDSISEFYPFKQHKDNHWSLEHIHARNSENFDKTKKDTWLDWLNSHKQILQEFLDNDQFDKGQVLKVIDDINRYNNKQITWERFSVLFDSINNIFTDEQESIDLESEGFLNLALLSQPDNSALNNAVFEVKRREIIRLDKEGSFIPICTRRLFMKYYNDNSSNEQFYFWTKKDRENYGKAIREKLEKYLPTPNSVQDEDE